MPAIARTAAPGSSPTTARVYSTEFFEFHSAGSQQSADVIAPLVVDMVGPSSVVDFGCGVGGWLAAFRACGIPEICGIDGDYVDRGQLRVPSVNFLARDLTQPVALQRVFDLAVSLEVAEHLPADAAEVFVSSLTAAAPVVLFSAAVPLQGGDHHINEQWPSYWARLFDARGYVAIDAIRPKVWSDERVEWWYAQNLLIFCRHSSLGRYPALVEAHAQTDLARLDIVHPRNYMTNYALTGYWVPRASFGQLLRALPNAAKRRLWRTPKE
jgi:SAM-dependent methyltransferase